MRLSPRFLPIFFFLAGTAFGLPAGAQPPSDPDPAPNPAPNPAPDPAEFPVEIPADLLATAATLRDRALEDEARERAWGFLESLTVEVGPRLAGSAGDRAAVAWAVRTLGEMGFEEVSTEPVTVPHWVRGEGRGEILAPFPQPMLLTALGGSVATPAEGLTAEVVRAGSLAELAEIPAERVAGKIVFLDQAMERHKTGMGYGQVVAIRSAGPSAAAKKGAVALLIRSVGTGGHRFPHTGALRYEDDVAKIPAAALATPDADVLAAQVLRAAADPELGPVRVHLVLATETLPDAQSANVIAEVRGRERPEEIVLLGCHLDSWDLGTGTIDDGAGCAHVIAAADLIRRLPRAPRRTVRVVLFANEELGLSGARAYAAAHEEELARHVLAIESDFGAGAIWRFALSGDPVHEAEAEAFAAVLAPLGIEWAGGSAFGGADFIPLAEARVPVADLTPDGTYYFDYHHTADDTLDKVDPEALAQGVAAFAATAWWAAEREGDFGRRPADSESDD